MATETININAQAIKDYADNAASAAVSSANGYTDSAIATEVTNRNAAIGASASTKQNASAELTAIAGLLPVNDDIIQRKSGSWINRTMVQLWADLKSFADALYPAKNTIIDTVAMVAPGGGANWLNQPAALTFLLGQTRWVVPCDLSLKTECKVHVLTGSSGGVAGAKIRILYRTQAAGYSTTITDYVTVCTGELQAVIGSTTNTVTSSAWLPIVAGAKAPVIIAVAGIDGNGSASPTILSVYLETR